jgi:hypothetical protein
MISDGGSVGTIHLRAKSHRICFFVFYILDDVPPVDRRADLVRKSFQELALHSSILSVQSLRLKPKTQNLKYGTSNALKLA